MAGWISSKLKVAETLLQQIDQQAAESLRKNERPRSDDVPVGETLARTESIPLKDQLKKKAPDRNRPHRDLRRGYDPERHRKKLDAVEKPNSSSVEKPNSKISPAAAVADSDWTELLGSPDPITPVDHQNGVPGPGLRRDQKKLGIGVSSAPLEGRRSLLKVGRRSDVTSDNKVGFEASDGDRRWSNEEVGLSGSSDFSDSIQRKPVWESRVLESNVVMEPKEDGNGDVVIPATLENGLQSHSENFSAGEDGFVSVSVSGAADEIDDLKREVHGNSIGQRDGPDVAVGHSIPDDLPRSFSGSDERSDSDTDSSLTSDSEDEKEERRKRQEQILAEEVAAKAIEAIKERENMVARLEGEKQSLEKMLDEREKQQAQEASELQMSMTEIMEAVELEKQKHNSTRMEALACLAKLETTNAELARSLATTQRSLEVEVDRVAELRRQIDLKELANEELRRRMSNIHESTSSPSHTRASKGVEFELEILEAEYSVICDKIGQLKEKAKKLEENTEMIRKEIEDPTEVEVELKKRLAQLTDHLIQKQAQVEALTSEKAMLLFRLETVSRLLEESKSSSQLVDWVGPSARDDIEAGKWEPSDLNLRPLLRDRIRSGGQHLGSILRQLDALFSAGVVFLRRNPAAQMWALIYLVCLHLWVMYILVSHSQVSDEVGSGAVISLESINKTSGM
ncbi:golgin candidate 2 isoform X2 [Magnolia sinica]|uniref:golgin candidate 2 isoform X2 n=1 Tax=Magnolia sinica TaxID=86752 RepID=UPI00265B19AB|nr:golgin candidate 2 isoform X2 [Magnolia sinica]